MFKLLRDLGDHLRARRSTASRLGCVEKRRPRPHAAHDACGPDDLGLPGAFEIPPYLGTDSIEFRIVSRANAGFAGPRFEDAQCEEHHRGED